MHETLTNLVHPVLEHGLALKERLARGTAADLETERAVLKALLLAEADVRRWAEAGGEGRPGADGTEANPVAAWSGDHAPAAAGQDHFLGCRYALSCWLDELFVLDSPWSARWNEQKLEAELYGTNDRAWKFWQQARLAESRRGKDPLEVFYLCVALGFSGELREQPEKLRAWMASARANLGRIEAADAAAAAEARPPTHVPPLHGREQVRRMVLAGEVVLLLLIPVVAFLVVHKLGQ